MIESNPETIDAAFPVTQPEQQPPVVPQPSAQIPPPLFATQPSAQIPPPPVATQPSAQIPPPPRPQRTIQQQYAPPAYHTNQAGAPVTSAYQQTNPAYRQAPPAYQPPAPVAYRPPAPVVSRQQPKAQSGSKWPALVMGIIGVLIGALLTAGILFIATSGFSASPTNHSAQGGSGGGGLTINPPSEDATLAEAVAAKVLPSVVNIDVYATSSGRYYNDTNSRSRGDEVLEEYGLGSGVVLTEDGYILTNYHVVEGGDEFLVRFDQETQYRATLVGMDESSDLAVLKVEATGLIPIEIGDSSTAAVGQWVMALGSPFGLEKSASQGIVSGLFRSTVMESTTGYNYYANMIQTDAAINPGNSGGALVNAKGELIGINTLISSDSGSSSGVGFAIPSNFAMGVAQQIMNGKEVQHAYLGVQLSTVDAGNASSLNSQVDTGAYISMVVEDTPAEAAGLKVGDIVTKMDNLRISSAAELIINVRGHFVGDKVTLEILRDGKTMTVEVVLGSDMSR